MEKKGDCSTVGIVMAGTVSESASCLVEFVATGALRTSMATSPIRSRRSVIDARHLRAVRCYRRRLDHTGPMLMLTTTGG